MIEAIRDVDNHLICYVDSTRGLIEHTFHKEMIKICLPVGGEILFIKGECFTIIRRINSQGFFVHSDHYHGLDI